MKYVWIIQYGQLGIEDSCCYTSAKGVLGSLKYVYGADSSVEIIRDKKMIVAMRGTEQLAIALRRPVNNHAA